MGGGLPLPPLSHILARLVGVNVGMGELWSQKYIYINIIYPISGGAEGNRTPDLDVANVALSQLSYGPIGFPSERLAAGIAGIMGTLPKGVKAPRYQFARPTSCAGRYRPNQSRGRLAPPRMVL